MPVLNVKQEFDSYHTPNSTWVGLTYSMKRDAFKQLKPRFFFPPEKVTFQLTRHKKKAVSSTVIVLKLST